MIQDILFLILVILVILVLWQMIYDTNRFVKVAYTVQDQRIKRDFRAVLLADLHNKSFGKGNESLLQAIDELQPQMILVAGDMMTAKPREDFAVAADLLKKLSEKYPIYYGSGNHEYRTGIYPETYGSMYEEYSQAMEEIGVKWLINAREELTEYGICIYGAEIDKQFYKRFKPQEMPAGYMQEILGRVDKEQYNILLAHNPVYFENYGAWGADLVLSGHIHGGIVRVPFWGKGVVSPSITLFPKYDGGSFELPDSRMILSRGLGVHTIPVRLYNPGEVVVIDFKSN